MGDANMITAPAKPESLLPDALGADASVLLSARNGSEPALAKLIRQHQTSVFTLALRFTGNRADAEELAQDTFMEMHSVLSQIRSPVHLRHWLLRTVSHRSLDRLRQRGRRPKLVSFDTADIAMDTTATPEADHLATSRLHGLLLQLAPDARAVMLLRLLEDLDPSDIATVLAMRLNTVKSHMRRSLDWLRAQYAGVERGT
jgi:RNA polymerase sigma-70 factor (ECF subfamily)